MLQDLPFDKQSIHDIRLRFKVPDIWNVFSMNPKFNSNAKSQDIVVPTWNKNKSLVRTLIHKTDTVSVIISCSLQPIPLDANGIIYFFNLLTRVEEKLQTLLDNSILIALDQKCDTIPQYGKWIITMWHFGRDSLSQYSGEKFSVTVENAQRILTRIYAKDLNGKNRIRIERQEYPRKTVLEAVNEKLGNDSSEDQCAGYVS
jgi:hypothetical protein